MTMILNDRSITDDGLILCDKNVIREALYVHGDFTNATVCLDLDEVKLFNDAKRLLDSNVQRLHSETDLNIINDELIWFSPDKWKSWDVNKWCLSQCNTIEQINRVTEELDLFKSRGLIPMLIHLKFLVEHWRENKIVWGVGRGSSISSYVLFLLGVHRIDPMLYDIDYTEFFKNI